MIKVFIDSNIWVRPLVEKTPQAESCTQIITACQKGLLKPYTSTIVLLEVNHVLISFYQLKSPIVTKIIGDIMKTKNLVLVEQTTLKSAIAMHKKTKVKLTDCLIATQCPSKAIFVTNDKHFQKFPNLIVRTPTQMLQEIAT